MPKLKHIPSIAGPRSNAQCGRALTTVEGRRLLDPPSHLDSDRVKSATSALTAPDAASNRACPLTAESPFNPRRSYWLRLRNQICGMDRPQIAQEGRSGPSGQSIQGRANCRC